MLLARPDATKLLCLLGVTSGACGTRAATLAQAQARAKENGTKLQLAMLRERRSMREAASSPAAE